MIEYWISCVLPNLTLEKQAPCVAYSLAVSTSREERAGIFATVQAFSDLNGCRFHLFFGKWQKNKERVSVSFY